MVIFLYPRRYCILFYLFLIYVAFSYPPFYLRLLPTFIHFLHSRLLSIPYHTNISSTYNLTFNLSSLSPHPPVYFFLGPLTPLSSFSIHLHPSFLITFPSESRHFCILSLLFFPVILILRFSLSFLSHLSHFFYMRLRLSLVTPPSASSCFYFL